MEIIRSLGAMLYLGPALVVYAVTARHLLRHSRPETFREAVGGALACGVVAAAWPVAVIWRGLAGGSPPEDTPPPIVAPARVPRSQEA